MMMNLLKAGFVNVPAYPFDNQCTLMYIRLQEGDNMKQPRLPKANSPRIIVDCLETKKRLVEMADANNETVKEIVIRLVRKEYEKWGAGERR